MVSFHAHHSPVKFLVMASPVRNAVPTITDSPRQRVPPTEEDEALGSAASFLAEGDGVHPSVPIRQDSRSSSRSSLEHGPEDGAIYDLLSDPAHSQNTKRAQRANVSSVLVLSGGSGHRKVIRKSKAARHEENVPTVMVWQIPVPDV